MCSAVYITGINGIILRLGERDRIKEGEREKQRERENKNEFNYAATKIMSPVITFQYKCYFTQRL